jgi:hypothetical protein
MSVTIIDRYKIVDSEVTDIYSVDTHLAVLMQDLTGDPDFTSQMTAQLMINLADADKVVFISIYKENITPDKFVGLSVVKWIEPADPTDPAVVVSDHWYPVLVTHRDTEETNLLAVLSQFIDMKMESQQIVQEIFND